MYLSRAIGIDLGTTNSAVAMLTADGQDISLLEDRFKRKTFPSMVGWDPETQSMLTAWEAWNRRALDPMPIASIKRRMGTSRMSTLGDKELTPEEVSAEILKRLAAEMHAHLERERESGAIAHDHAVDRAVVTIPAYFDAQQIDATRQAGEQAGLEVLGLLQEPTAAAMYYAWKHGIGDGHFLVYDLGGGTFDVSIIRCIMGEYQVLGIDGDNFLGGDDLDRRLAEHFREHLVDEKGYALDLDIQESADDRTRFTLLQRLAQEVKEALSTQDIQYVARRDLFEDQEGQKVSIELEYSRAQFEALIADFVQETIASCERALLKSAESADVTLRDIDYVLLVGGSTRIPLVQQSVARAFCGREKSHADKPLMDEPDTCVALGAAIHAANLGGVKLYNEDRTQRIEILTPLGSDNGELRLAARFAPEGGDDVLDMVDSVVLIDAQGDVAAITRPEIHEDDEVLYFSIESISLPDPGHHAFSLELCDDEADPLLAFEVELKRLGYGELLRSTGSALSNPSVLAKDIYLEVVRDGRPARQILLPTGTSLPAEGRFRFYTADQSGAVILRLFQNRLPIRTIHLTIPTDTEAGSPVDLNIEVDDTMHMTASGEVLGQTFWAQIEPPPEKEMRAWGEIEQMLGRVEQVERELWGHEERYFRERTSLLVAGIHETARTDPDKLQVLVTRLEDVLEEYQSRDKELTPGWGRFQSIMNAIKRVVWRGDGPKLGQHSEQWRARLSDTEQRAERAFEHNDQAEWSRIFNQTQAIWESLAQDEYRFTRGDPGLYVAKLHAGIREELQHTIEKIDEFSVSSNPETAQLQRAKLRELRQELTSKVESPLKQLDPDNLPHAQARQQLDKISEYIQHIERQLEKVPAIGLVRK